MQNETGRLIEQVLMGVSDAPQGLWRHLRPRLVLWASTRLSPALRAHLDADDAAQHILTSLHESLPQFQGQDASTFLGWVFKIAEHRLADLGKHHASLKRTPTGKQPPSPRECPSPSEGAVRSEALANMRRHLASLAPNEAEALRLRYLEARDYRQIAALWQCDARTARVRVCRALKALRTRMGPCDESR